MSPQPDDFVAGSTAPLVQGDYGPTRLILFNRPAKKNALTREMRREFARMVADAEAESAVRCLIITGAGECFTAGVDVKESAGEPDHPLVKPNPAEVLRECTKPVIAAIDGHCIGGGLEIALSCSMAIASERAQFADFHARRSLIPAWGLTALLPAAVGFQRAMQLALTGVPIDAATANAWGIVGAVTNASELLKVALEWAQRVCEADYRSVHAQLGLYRGTRNAIMADALAREAALAAAWRQRRTERQE